MFRALLRELAKQKIPSGSEVTFIFVENDADVSIAKTVDKFKEALTANGTANPRICVEPEPKLGIPFARNRMLRIALHFELEYLAVLDDDEYPIDENWLSEMFWGIHKRDLDVAGGLENIEALDQEQIYSFRLLPRLVYKHNRARGLKRQRRKLAAYRSGNDHRLFHRGSNVIYRLPFIRKNEILFNEKLEFACGEDREIVFEIKKAGGRAGLIPSAIVCERIHDERLNLAYAFRIKRAHAVVMYGRQYKNIIKASKSNIPKNLTLMLAKLILGLSRLLLVPLTGGRSLVGAAESFGVFVGALSCLSGQEKLKTYREPDGL